MPAFNSANTGTAVPLSPSQKFRLAFKSATDPFTFALASVDAGIDQLQDDYHGYGQGVAGYSKRFGASYLDTFNGTMLGNALLPVVFHQDPRYFRKGTGSVKGPTLVRRLVDRSLQRGQWPVATKLFEPLGESGRWHDLECLLSCGRSWRWTDFSAGCHRFCRRSTWGHGTGILARHIP